MSALSTLLTLVQPDQPVPAPAPPARETAPAINYPAIMPILIVLGAACVGVLFEAVQLVQTREFVERAAGLGLDVMVETYAGSHSWPW